MMAERLREMLYTYRGDSDVRFVLSEPNDGKEYDVEAVISYAADNNTYVVLVEVPKREPRSIPVGNPEDEVKEL